MFKKDSRIHFNRNLDNTHLIDRNVLTLKKTEEINGPWKQGEQSCHFFYFQKSSQLLAVLETL